MMNFYVETLYITIAVNFIYYYANNFSNTYNCFFFENLLQTMRINIQKKFVSEFRLEKKI